MNVVRCSRTLLRPTPHAADLIQFQMVLFCHFVLLDFLSVFYLHAFILDSWSGCVQLMMHFSMSVVVVSVEPIIMSIVQMLCYG